MAKCHVGQVGMPAALGRVRQAGRRSLFPSCDEVSAARRTKRMQVQLQSLDLHHPTVLHLLLPECRVHPGERPKSETATDGERDLALSRPNTGRSDSGAQRRADGADRTHSRKMLQPMTEIIAQIAHLEVESRFDPTTCDREFVIASTLLSQVISKVIASGARLRVKLRMSSAARTLGRSCWLNFCTTRRSCA